MADPTELSIVGFSSTYSSRYGAATGSTRTSVGKIFDFWSNRVRTKIQRPTSSFDSISDIRSEPLPRDIALDLPF